MDGAQFFPVGLTSFYHDVMGVMGQPILGGVGDEAMSGDIREFLVLHNIASPYRLHMFRMMRIGLEKRGIGFKVHFMAKSHEDRAHWKIEELGFDGVFWRDIGRKIGKKEWHINPGLVRELMRSKPRYLMVGGPWDSITAAAVSLLRPATEMIAWFEGNTSTPGKISGVALAFKRRILRDYKFFAVPGSEGAKYAHMIIGESAYAKTVILPNIVEETRFACNKVNREHARNQMGWPLDRKIAIWPARLTEAKGIVPFLNAVTRDDFSDWMVMILGEGHLREKIERTIDQRGLRGVINLSSGALGYDRMPIAYLAADLMILPSLEDPNPLSPVEAMYSGLPLLLSSHIGNYPEALRPGINGWGLDPKNPQDVKAKVREAFSTDMNRLREMGEVARTVVDEFWNSRRAIDRFLNAVL